MNSQAEKELRAGISIFVDMCSKLGLTCTPITSFSLGGPVRFDLSNGTKEVRLTLGYEFVTELLGTKEFQSALSSYLAGVALRFQDPSFVEFSTLCGIQLVFEVEFPFARSTRGGSYDFVHVRTRTGIDAVLEANFSVHITHTVSINLATLESVVTEPLVINAIRKFIDAKRAVFYPEGKHPLELQEVTIQSSDYDYKAKKFLYHMATAEEIASFLKRKVYWLGFRRGSPATGVCIADPYDAAYLGGSKERLQQVGAILSADGVVQLDRTGLYASAGSKLLLEARALEREHTDRFGGSKSAPGPIRLQPKEITAEATPDFDVFISHATEDKPYVESLVKALKAAGIHVWFDKTALQWGDDLRATIDRGLTACRFGIVVFSTAFLRKKKWTEYELSSLFAREEPGKKIILPIWHGISREDLLQYGPALADRLAKISSVGSHSDIVESLLAMLGRPTRHERAAASGAAPAAPDPRWEKPNAVAYAQYETKGKDAQKAEAYVRPSTQVNGMFTFENSFGEEEHGSKEEIAKRFVTFDRDLAMKGYIRMHYGNAGDTAFNL